MAAYLSMNSERRQSPLCFIKKVRFKMRIQLFLEFFIWLYLTCEQACYSVLKKKTQLNSFREEDVFQHLTFQ